MNILLTGFEPFGGEAINPSWEVARALDGEVLGEGRVHSRCLPTTFAGAPVALRAALADLQPRVVVALGLASGRTEISVERVAINLIDARIADNLGQRPLDQPVRADAPPAYFSTLPVHAIRDGLRAAGHPAGLSLSAGAFVCNQLFFELQHALAGQAARSGFIHVPALPQQAAAQAGSLPSMALASQIAAIRLALVLAQVGTAPARTGEGAPIA